MTDTYQFILLAEYNQLMNQRQYAAAAKLSKTDLCADKGVFFNSVLGTLNHILLQVTALLSQHGIDFGETDLIEIINECSSS